MADETLAELYLKERGGDIMVYNGDKRRGAREGQAWFNALGDKDKARLRGRQGLDPFYLDGAAAATRIIQAITFLLDTE